MGPGRARGLDAFALGALVVYASSARSTARAQAFVIGPGREAEVAALVFPGDGPAALAEGLRVGGAQIGGASIDVTLEGPGHRGLVRMHPRGTATEGAPCGESASFTCRLVEGAEDPAVVRAAEALAARVAARDRGGFFGRWVAADGAPVLRARSIPSGLASGLTRARRALWLALSLGLVVLAGLAWREGVRPSRRDAAIALGLGALALGLRVLVPPWAPLHENDHGITELGGLLGRIDDHEARLYGGGYLHFIGWASTLLGRAPEAPFLAASIAGALVAPSLFALARALTPARVVGPFAAGLALALHPAHLRLSTSESQRGLAGLLFVLGAALAAWAFRVDPRRATREGAFMLAACAWALGLELHVQTMLLPLAGAAIVLLALGARAHAPHPITVLAGVVLVGGFAWAHLEELRPVLPDVRDPAFSPWLVLGRWLASRNAIGDPTFAPALLLPCALVGALGLARARAWRTLAGVAAALALLGPASFLVDACRADAIRYQLDWQLVLALLLVGLPDPAHLMRLGPARAGALAALGPLALIAAPCPGSSTSRGLMSTRRPSRSRMRTRPPRTRRSCSCPRGWPTTSA